MLLRSVLAATALYSASGVQGIELNVNSRDSIQNAANIALHNAMPFYNKPEKNMRKDLEYYWWQAGAYMGVLIQHWSIFKNDSWVDFITEGIQAQVGEKSDFEPEEERLELGNDDQAFWAFTVLDAAEQGFPDPPEDQPSWLGLAQSVFNRQTLQWDESTCGGGMRWQKFLQNRGFDYKNAPTNGGYFNIAARLARFTGNQTYVEYADRMFDWIENSNFWVIEEDGLHLYDGVHIVDCPTQSRHNPSQYSYNVAFVISGCAYMYDISEGSRKDFWRKRIDMLLENAERWFYEDLGRNEPPRRPSVQTTGGYMAEAACEFGEPQTCNNDQPVFKGFTTRWLAITATLAPWTNDTIMPRIVDSAQGAARQCVGTGPPIPASPDTQIPGTVCGRRWYQEKWDGFQDAGSQMSAASAFQSLLIHQVPKPLTLESGGTSRSDPTLGSNDQNAWIPPSDIHVRDITAGDKAGAAIVTLIGAGGVAGMVSWMILS